jgi:hypothetical protein
MGCLNKQCCQNRLPHAPSRYTVIPRLFPARKGRLSRTCLSGGGYWPSYSVRIPRIAAEKASREENFIDRLCGGLCAGCSVPGCGAKREPVFRRLGHRRVAARARRSAGCRAPEISRSRLRWHRCTEGMEGPATRAASPFGAFGSPGLENGATRLSRFAPPGAATFCAGIVRCDEDPGLMLIQPTQISDGPHMETYIKAGANVTVDQAFL